ncbi:MAG: hypothetical protein J6P87_03960 [Lachnospiraceae bacterium]|nr:hypothetical protein [Lachnospiraceae bacterium]
MYIQNNKNVLSGTLMLSAAVRILTDSVSAALHYRATKSTLPTFGNAQYWHAQNILSVVQILCTAIVFLAAWRKIRHYRNVLPKEEFAEMAKLQEEVIGDRLASLSSYSIVQLLQVWAVILIGVQIIYDVNAIIYRDMIIDMAGLISTGETGAVFAEIYNDSHGFKYMGMAIAIMLGIYVTGVFLRDRVLKIAVLVTALGFISAFLFFGMQIIQISSIQIGIVWTSVIFHLLETAGLFCMALYIRKHYKGV